MQEEELPLTAAAKLNYCWDKFVTIISNRTNMIYILSCTAIITSMIVMIVHQNFTSYFIAGILVSSTISAVILIAYSSTENFRFDMYITLFCGYFLSFSAICMLPLDAALATSSKNGGTINRSSEFQTYWTIMYWLIFFLNNLVFNIQQFYHQNGYLSFRKKIKQAFKDCLRLLIIGIALFIVLCIVCKFYLNLTGFTNIIAVALLLSNVYGISILVFLFGFGLVQVPFFVWNATSGKSTLDQKLGSAHKLFKEYQKAYWKYSDMSDIVSRVIACNSTASPLKEYVQKLQEENVSLSESISTKSNQKSEEFIGYKFEKSSQYKIFSEAKAFQAKLASSTSVENLNEQTLASIRQQMISTRFAYQRCVLKWKRASDEAISAITEDGIAKMDQEFGQIVGKSEPNNRSGSSRNIRSDSTMNNNFIGSRSPLYLNVKPMHLALKIAYRVLAVILAIFSILIIWCEASLIFGTPNPVLIFYQIIKNSSNVPGIIAMVLLVLAYVIFCTYFSLGRLKIFGSFELFPLFSHPNTMTVNATFCLVLTFPLSYNVMLMFGVIGDAPASSSNFSGFSMFYNPLKEIPFFGNYYNLIVCFCVVIIGIVSSFTKSQNLIKKLSKNAIEMNIDVDDDLLRLRQMYVYHEIKRRRSHAQQKDSRGDSENNIGKERSLSYQQQGSIQEEVEDVSGGGETEEENNDEQQGEKRGIFSRVSSFFSRSKKTERSDSSNRRPSEQQTNYQRKNSENIGNSLVEGDNQKNNKKK